MFVQVIKGRVNDPAGVRRQDAHWREELLPGATGFLGSTVGVTADGTFFAFARFADEAAAKANSVRPEQHAWWEETAKIFDGEPTFAESNDVATLFDGGSDSARFVQVMEGSVKDRARAESLETTEMMEQLRSARPDLIGSLRVWLPGGKFVEAAYFTSEQDARAGETSPEFSGPQQAYMDLFGDMTFYDLHDPLLTGP
jgi:hypothetical protein